MGQGLAGSVLALKLVAQGRQVIVIDKAERSLCSKVAAGIWNPVVFKRLTKSWRVDALLPEMLQFYRAQERRFNCRLITERDIVKFFSEEQEYRLWQKKAQGELGNILDPQIYTRKYNEEIVQGAAGFSKVKKAGSLEVKTFLDRTRDLLVSTGSYCDEQFDHKELIPGEKMIYKNHEAAVIVFAEGHLISHNPYFSYIPFKPVKGEILTVQTDALNAGNDILNKNAFLLPHGPDTYKAGATYNWEDLSDHPTMQGRGELEKKLRQITTGFYEVTGHQAGVRPSVIDRRPVIGAHPLHRNMYVFNGMGTKGVMLAPYFAERLIDHIYHQAPLDGEVQLERFATHRKISA